MRSTKGKYAFDEVNRKRMGRKSASIAKKAQKVKIETLMAIEKAGLSDPERSSMTMREAKEPVRDGQVGNEQQYT